MDFLVVESDQKFPDSAVVVFHEGLPGVSGKEFIILKPEGLEPIVVLQSLSDSAVGIPAIPCKSVVDDYRVQFDDSDRSALGLRVGEQESEMVYLAVLLIDGGEVGPCCNLAAPIVINPANNRGCQVTHFDGTYPALHPIAGE